MLVDMFWRFPAYIGHAVQSFVVARKLKAGYDAEGALECIDRGTLLLTLYEGDMNGRFEWILGRSTNPFASQMCQLN